MKISAKIWLLLGVILFNQTICSAQYSIAGDATQTTDFTSYTGTGFSPGAATTGSLDSNTWRVVDDNGTMDSDFDDTNTAGTDLDGKDIMNYKDFPESTEISVLVLPLLTSGQYILTISDGRVTKSIPFIKH